MARKQRGRNEGSIFQRADGKWSAEVSMGYQPNGKRKRKTVYGKTKGEVQDKLDRMKANARSGTIPAAGALTVGLLLDRWLAAMQPDTAPKTHEERSRCVRNHLTPRIGRVKLSALNALHVEGLYADMRADGVGGWTVRTAANLLSIALNYGVGRKLLAVNPSRDVPKPKGPKRDMLFLDDAQARAVRGVSATKPVGTLVVTALGTGCRQGELLALGWDDVDLKRAILTIRRSLTHTKEGGYALKEPKTAASRRTVTLPPFVVAALTARKAAAMQAGRLADPVFCTRTGGFLDKKNVLRAFRAVVKATNKAGEGDSAWTPIPPKLRFHDLRHTVASLLLSGGESLRAVAARLGHAKPTMTLAVYGHCMPNDDAKLSAGLERMLG